MSYADNPRANQLNPSDAPQEPTGAVTSDSLAAESLRSGGGFSENENAAEMSVKGSNSTFNTTDTSGATTLDPASDGAEREQQDLQDLPSNERGVAGVKYPAGVDQAEFSGTHNLQGYTGGPSADKSSSGGSGGYNTTMSPGQGTTAPTYAATTAGNIRQHGELQPKGDDLTEGGIPQTNTFTGNVGGGNDPGRLAEQNFEGMSEANINAAGGLKYSAKDDKSGGQYDVLESERI